jgi:hypothetical protein
MIKLYNERYKEMKRTQILIIASMSVLSFFLVTQGTALADNPAGIPSPPLLFPTPRTIMISDKRLDTQILSIDRYTEVTWINDSNSGVRIEFGQGPNCKEISAATFPALGIRMQPDKYFITSSIPPKGTLRLRFKEFGDYKYKVEYVNKSQVDHGELKVF